MKKLLIIPFLLLSLIGSAQTKWYVATTGSDSHGKGTLADPWLTVKHAADTVTGANFDNDTIVVGAGTFTETAQSAIGEKINVKGAGATTIVASTASLNAILLLESVTEGTDGSQTISNIRFTGGDAVNYGIECVARSNVKVNDCEFDGFEYYALRFRGGTPGSTGRPVIWATGNQIYSNTITDCGYDEYDTPNTTWLVYGGGIEITGQSGILVHNNNINNAVGYGWGIRCISDSGFIRGAKIYDNTIRSGFRDSTSQTSYSFNIELWTGKGGNEVYGNDCNGTIDYSGYGWDDTGGYGFALKTYDNDITLTTMPTNSEEAGMIFESGCTGGVYFYNNRVKNFSKGLVFSLRENSLVQGFDGVYIHYNIFSEIGRVSGSMTGTGVEYNMVRNNINYMPDVNDFRIYNNVFHRTTTPVQTYGINMVAVDATSGVGADWTNVSVANNITYNVYTPCKWEDQTVDIANVEHNIFYNATNNNRFVDCDTSSIMLETGITDNPLFTSSTNFRLQPGSPAIDAGMDVNLTSDADGHVVGSAPDIGAYERGQRYLINNGKLEMNNGKLVVINR